MLRSAVSGYIDRIVDGRALRQRVSRNQDQSRHFGDVRATSALPPKTDIWRKGRHVSKVANNGLVRQAKCSGAGLAMARSSQAQVT
jgi:hypothetical protein